MDGVVVHGNGTTWIRSLLAIYGWVDMKVGRFVRTGTVKPDTLDELGG